MYGNTNTAKIKEKKIKILCWFRIYLKRGNKLVAHNYEM
jgi:hypothetical protein